MSFLKSRQLSTPPTGMSAGQWLEARKSEGNESAKSQNKKYAFLDDTSSEESFSASNFLKKSAQSEDSYSKQQIKKTTVPDRPKTSRGQSDPRSSTAASSRGSSALNRFSQLERDILSRQSKPMPSVFSSSDMDFDISSDSEIKREMFSIKKRDNIVAPRPTEDATSQVKDNIDEKLPPSYLKPDADLAEKRKILTKKKAVSFASNLVETLHSESDVSLDHFLPEQYSDEISLDEVLSEPNIMMTLDDLHPVGEAHHQPEVLKLHATEDVFSSIDYDDSHESRDFRSDSVASAGTDSNMFNIQSIEELVYEKPSTSAIPRPRKITPAKVEDPQKAESHDDDYSDDFHSSDDGDDTLKDTESIAEEFTEEIKTESARSITESIEDEVRERVSYSDSFDTLTSGEVTSSLTSGLPRFESAAVQTDPIDINNLRLEDKLFPKFTESEKTFYKPSQVINNEALSVLASYSPAVLAVQEMLKQQLAFTRDFITRSERLHKAAADTLVADYQYASLEDARQVINMERRRMNLPPKYPASS